MLLIKPFPFTSTNMSQAAEDQSARWWEFYAVRYAMGTVVGAVIFFFLCNSNPALRPMLFGAEAGKIDGTSLALLAGYGLAFCYIASAPILVFHVSRFLLDPSGVLTVDQRRLWWLLAPPIGLTMVFTWFAGTTLLLSVFYGLVFFIAAFIVWPQYLAVITTISQRAQLLDFYKKLASKRSSAVGGLTDSYKHMREHGNSFLIVVLEIILALLLYVAGNLSPQLAGATAGQAEKYVLPYIIIILMWIIPAACVWVIGTLFERSFVDAP